MRRARAPRPAETEVTPKVTAERAFATDPSQLIPECASKFQHEIRGGSGRAMLSYLKKFAMDIFPSVAATIIGAYIVNHYIVVKPDAAATAAATASANSTTAAKPADKPTVVSSLPEPGVKAKGISERALSDRPASEKAAATEKPAEKSADLKATDAPADTASIAADPRHHATPSKAVAKLTPSSSAVEAAVTPDDGRDANDLARAAIERLRKEGAPRAQDAARPEAPRTVATPSIRPLPPPIMVSSPSDESVNQASQPAYTASTPDPDRITPPADIPTAMVRPPLDLRAEASESLPKPHTTVADDMLSAAKSVFHAVLPKSP